MQGKFEYIFILKKPNAQLTWEAYDQGDAWIRNWDKLGVADFDAEVESILHKLATGKRGSIIYIEIKKKFSCHNPN